MNLVTGQNSGFIQCGPKGTWGLTCADFTVLAQKYSCKMDYRQPQDTLLLVLVPLNVVILREQRAWMRARRALGV